MSAKRQKNLLQCLSPAAVLPYAQEMCKTLASPNDEEMSHTARMMAKPEVKEEEKGKTRNVQQIKSRTVLPKQKPGTHELKMAMLKRGEWRESKHVQFCKAPTCSFSKSPLSVLHAYLLI